MTVLLIKLVYCLKVIEQIVVFGRHGRKRRCNRRIINTRCLTA